MREVPSPRSVRVRAALGDGVVEAVFGAVGVEEFAEVGGDLAE